MCIYSTSTVSAGACARTFYDADLCDPRQLYTADHGRRAWLTAETFTAPLRRASIWPSAEDDVDWQDLAKDEVLTDDDECVSTLRMVAYRKPPLDRPTSVRDVYA